MGIKLRLIILVLCALVSASSNGRAEETKIGAGFLLNNQNLTMESCPRIVEVLKKPLVTDGGVRKIVEVVWAASWTLVLDCPTEPPNLPISVLRTIQGVPLGDGGSLILGTAYEYGIRVEPDLDAAKYWYRRVAFMFLNHTEEQWNDIRTRVAGINPKVRRMSEAEIEAAWAAGELKSPILEKEIAAVQKLMNGPVVDIVVASDHLIRGTGGFPKNKKAAQRILEITAQKGVPEAQYALALGILDRRFPALRPTRHVQLLEAQRFTNKGRSSRFSSGDRGLCRFV